MVEKGCTLRAENPQNKRKCAREHPPCSRCVSFMTYEMKMKYMNCVNRTFGERVETPERGLLQHDKSFSGVFFCFSLIEMICGPEPYGDNI